MKTNQKPIQRAIQIINARPENIRDDENISHLFSLASNGEITEIKSLPKTYDLNSINPISGNNIIHEFLNCPDDKLSEALKLNAIKYFIENKNFGINETGEYNRSYLHIAAKNKYETIVNYLLEKDIDTEIIDNYGHKAVHYSLTAEIVQCVDEKKVELLPVKKINKNNDKLLEIKKEMEENENFLKNIKEYALKFVTIIQKDNFLIEEAEKLIKENLINVTTSNINVDEKINSISENIYIKVKDRYIIPNVGNIRDDIKIVNPMSDAEIKYKLGDIFKNLVFDLFSSIKHEPELIEDYINKTFDSLNNIGGIFNVKKEFIVKYTNLLSEILEKSGNINEYYISLLNDYHKTKYPNSDFVLTLGNYNRNNINKIFYNEENINNIIANKLDKVTFIDEAILQNIDDIKDLVEYLDKNNEFRNFTTEDRRIRYSYLLIKNAERNDLNNINIANDNNFLTTIKKIMKRTYELIEQEPEEIKNLQKYDINEMLKFFIEQVIKRTRNSYLIYINDQQDPLNIFNVQNRKEIISGILNNLFININPINLRNDIRETLLSIVGLRNQNNGDDLIIKKILNFNFENFDIDLEEIIDNIRNKLINVIDINNDFDINNVNNANKNLIINYLTLLLKYCLFVILYVQIEPIYDSLVNFYNSYDFISSTYSKYQDLLKFIKIRENFKDNNLNKFNNNSFERITGLNIQTPIIFYKKFLSEKNINNIVIIKNFYNLYTKKPKMKYSMFVTLVSFLYYLFNLNKTIDFTTTVDEIYFNILIYSNDENDYSKLEIKIQENVQNNINNELFENTSYEAITDVNNSDFLIYGIGEFLSKNKDFFNRWIELLVNYYDNENFDLNNIQNINDTDKYNIKYVIDMYLTFYFKNEIQNNIKEAVYKSIDSNNLFKNEIEYPLIKDENEVLTNFHNKNIDYKNKELNNIYYSEDYYKAKFGNQCYKTNDNIIKSLTDKTYPDSLYYDFVIDGKIYDFIINKKMSEKFNDSYFNFSLMKKMISHYNNLEIFTTFYEENLIKELRNNSKIGDNILVGIGDIFIYYLILINLTFYRLLNRDNDNEIRDNRTDLYDNNVLKEENDWKKIINYYKNKDKITFLQNDDEIKVESIFNQIKNFKDFNNFKDFINELKKDYLSNKRYYEHQYINIKLKTFLTNYLADPNEEKIKNESNNIINYHKFYNKIFENFLKSRNNKLIIENNTSFSFMIRNITSILSFYVGLNFYIYLFQYFHNSLDNLIFKKDENKNKIKNITNNILKNIKDYITNEGKEFFTYKFIKAQLIFKDKEDEDPDDNTIDSLMTELYEKLNKNGLNIQDNPEYDNMFNHVKNVIFPYYREIYKICIEQMINFADSYNRYVINETRDLEIFVSVVLQKPNIP